LHTHPSTISISALQLQKYTPFVVLIGELDFVLNFNKHLTKTHVPKFYNFLYKKAPDIYRFIVLKENFSLCLYQTACG